MNAYKKNQIVELNEKAGVLGDMNAKGKITFVYNSLWGFKYRINLTSVIFNPFYSIGDDFDIKEDWIKKEK